MSNTKVFSPEILLHK